MRAHNIQTVFYAEDATLLTDNETTYKVLQRPWPEKNWVYDNIPINYKILFSAL